MWGTGIVQKWPKIHKRINLVRFSFTSTNHTQAILEPKTSVTTRNEAQKEENSYMDILFSKKNPDVRLG